MSVMSGPVAQSGADQDSPHKTRSDSTRKDRDMKKWIVRQTTALFTLATCLLALLTLPSDLAASPSVAEEVHFCVPVDIEQWRRDIAPSADKWAADMHAGEPRTVRMIYFLPNDRPFRQEVVDSMKTMILRVQTFYAEQMRAHGYGDMTFRIETDADGDPRVHRVNGQRADSHYLDNTINPVTNEIRKALGTGYRIDFIVVDNSTGSIGTPRGSAAGVGTGYPHWDRRGGFITGGILLVPGRFSFHTAAHELGHAFGLDHDFRDSSYIMSYGPGVNRLSACAASNLSAQPLFNSDIAIPIVGVPGGSRATFELVSPTRYPAGTRSTSLQFKVGDPDRLHLATLKVTTGDIYITSGFPEVMACRELAGEKDTVVEFEYDGVVPSSLQFGIPESLSDTIAHLFFVETIDVDGYKSGDGFGIAQGSPYLVDTLEGHGAVVFSPDGNTLAYTVRFTVTDVDGSNSYRSKIRLWDVAAGEEIATFESSLQGPLRSLAFSPDGNTLASSSVGPVDLYDVSNREHIATLEVRNTMGTGTLAFSPDGDILAVGARGRSINGKVQLWDVSSRDHIGTLEGHLYHLWSLAFSPDGNILASASDDDTIRLWDVTTREEIATLQGPGARKWSGVVSVAFSSDGNTMASGSRDGKVRLWDVATREEIATMEGHPSQYSYPFMVFTVAFSPDGNTLASGAQDGTIRLWDVSTQGHIATLAHIHWVNSLAFSPDGGRLAAATRENLELWDTSKWMRPFAFLLVKVSGDGQHAATGAELSRPLVVEVRDQYDSPLPDVPVTFTVTAGDGTFGDKLTSERAMTDANGRAQVFLTLGPVFGPNNVSVSLSGRERVAFHAEGVPDTDFDGNGTVDFSDFVQFAAVFGLGESDAGYEARYDLDGDGAIGFGDFLIFANAFGKELSPKQE
ncbi:MAG: PD40 domain-containing protein [Candidatus Latescibacteria bacterium]|nr:PD40 domain-containing protein [Candidatus Latescibacterota bacterium]